MEGHFMEEKQGQGAGDFTDLASTLNNGLSLFFESLSKAKAPPPILEKAKAILEGFRSLVSEIMDGGAEGGAEPAGGTDMQQTMGKPAQQQNMMSR